MLFRRASTSLLLPVGGNDPTDDGVNDYLRAWWTSKLNPKAEHSVDVLASLAGGADAYNILAVLTDARVPFAPFPAARRHFDLDAAAKYPRPSGKIQKEANLKQFVKALCVAGIRIISFEGGREQIVLDSKSSKSLRRTLVRTWASPTKSAWAALAWSLFVRFEVLDLDMRRATLREGELPTTGDALTELGIWVQAKTRGYPGIRFHSSERAAFQASFRDGMVLCALIHAHDPSLLPEEVVHAMRNHGGDDVRVRVDGALKAAHAIGVPRVFDPDQLRSGEMSPRAVLLLVAELRSALEKATILKAAERQRREQDGSVAQSIEQTAHLIWEMAHVKRYRLAQLNVEAPVVAALQKTTSEELGRRLQRLHAGEESPKARPSLDWCVAKLGCITQDEGSITLS